jgi:hypothetical protein
MKLSPEQVEKLKTALNVCKFGGVESVIFEPDMVRGINADGNFAIVSTGDSAPSLGQRAGITRVSDLIKLIDLFESCSIETKETERDELVSFEISSGRNKTTFRCASTTLIRAPKGIEHNPIFSVMMTQAEIKTILNAIRALAQETIRIVIGRSKEVTFSIVNTSGDSATLAIESKAVQLSEEEACVFDYGTPILSAILRRIIDENKDNYELQLGELGTIVVNLNGHNVTILPKADEGDF